MSEQYDFFGGNGADVDAIIDNHLSIDVVPQDIKNLFENMTLSVFKIGFKRYGAQSVLHRIRWHMHVEKGNREFKCNNNWAAPLARWFMKRHPECGEFFDLRQAASDSDL